MLLRWDLFFFFLFLVGEICLQPRILQAENLSDDLNLGELEHQRYQKIQQKQNAQKKRNEVFGKERGVLKHLQEIEIEMAALQLELKSHLNNIEIQKKKKKRIEQELLELRDRHLNYQKQAAKRITSIYKMGYRSRLNNQHQIVRLLMTSEGLVDLFTKYQYANLIVKSDQQLMANLISQQEAIKSTYIQLQKQVSTIETTTEAIKTKQKNLSVRKQRRKKLLDDYRTQRSTYDQVIKELRQAVIELEEALGILSTDTLMVKADRIRGIGIHDQGQLNWPIKGKIVKNQNPFDRGTTIRPITNKIGPSKVRSIAGGIVGKVIDSVVGYGNTVLILHGNAYTSVYTHLSTVDVKIGNVVTANQVLGQVGESGSLIGEVLYFELWHNYVPLDTAQWLER
ncbi:peptidoglycan DD-metalloendopeptidase family protein [Candidatus Poribacteria bacterium]|nr:peptidoglycan DD-metalloendopeptidase family protein [Candidatus Poribacteria bacterium]